MQDNIITIFGGTGFVGRYVVRELAKTGALIRVVSRAPQRGKELKTFGYVGQITLEKGSVLDRDSVARALENANIAINLVGILYERGHQRFSSVQAQGAERVAQAAKEARVERLVHMSALGVDKAGQSKYARSKLNGEKAVLAAFPDATVLRPGIIFGPEDDFFNRFASMAALLPVMPLIGGGRSRFQPIYAGDIALAVRAALGNPKTRGKTYELGGPSVYEFQQLLSYIMEETGHRRPFLPIPYSLASLIAAVAEWLPGRPPLTLDQVTLLKYDNVVSDDVLTLKDLGITPRSVEMICPGYLYRHRKGGKFHTPAARLQHDGQAA